MKSVCRKIAIAGLFIIFVPGLLPAEDVNLDKIVVTPSRTGESAADVSRQVDVITSKEIGDSGAQDLAEVLTGLTSVNISNYGGPGASKNIRMRGSTAAQVLVLLDGRPINNPRDGEVNLSDIPLDNIDKVEVMHGPGSSLYGSSAMGGVVNIITKNPPKKGEKAELYSSFGTARTYFERMLHGARISKFGYLLSGEYQSSEGFRDNAEFNAKDCNLKLEYELNGENNINLNSGFYKSKVGSPYKINTPDLDDKQRTLKRFFDFDWSFKPDAQTDFAAKIYQNYDRLEFIENSSDYTKDIHTTTVRGFDLQFGKRMLESYRLVCGFNYIKNINDSTSSAKHKYNVRAAYLENRLDLFDKKLGLNFGARLDDYSNFGTEINPNFGLLYKVNNDIKLHGLISRSFRAPTFNDLYWPRRDYYYGGFWVGGEEGNSNLKPEKGITGELGADIRINKYFGSGLTYYHSTYKQLIQWSDDGSGLWQPENVSSAIIDGIEFENKVYFSDNLEWDIEYTFLRAIDDKAHKYLIYQPKHKIDSSLKYKDHNGLTVEIRGQFTDKRYHTIDDPFYSTIKVKRFFILGLNISKKFKPGVTCFASIDNLLNRKYQVIRDYPMPGTSFNGGLKLEF